jgi:hypothetical protein
MQVAVNREGKTIFTESKKIRCFYSGDFMLFILQRPKCDITGIWAFYFLRMGPAFPHWPLRKERISGNPLDLNGEKMLKFCYDFDTFMTSPVSLG